MRPRNIFLSSSVLTGLLTATFPCLLRRNWGEANKHSTAQLFCFFQLWLEKDKQHLKQPYDSVANYRTLFEMVLFL